MLTFPSLFLLALLAAAPGPDQRVSVLGENAIPTMIAHAAALTVGVGTVAAGGPA